MSCEVELVAEVNGEEQTFNTQANALRVLRVASQLNIGVQVHSRVSEYGQSFVAELR